MGASNCMFLFLFVALLPSLSAISWATTNSYTEEILTQCRYTRYPNLCVQTLTGLGSKNDQNVDFLYALVNKTISETRLPRSDYVELSSHFISLEAQQAQMAIDDCQELTEMAVRRLNQAKEAIRKSPENYKEDIQTWLSAAITFLQTCKDTVEDHALSNFALSEIYKEMDYLSELCSNPLALANRITRNPKDDLPTRSRRLLGDENFPSWVSKSDRRLLESPEIRADAVVAKDGSGDFDTISEAIQSANGGRYVIYVKSGEYNEKISTKKDGITLIGDGKFSTIIHASSSMGKGSSLLGSSTFLITGDGFIARDIGIHNTAGAFAEQAIALTIASDRSVLYRCSVVGNQDTLYALSLRQFYRECDIHGTVDFIFGNAAAVFQSCSLYLRRPRSYDVILANGRTDPGQNTGFSLQNCKIAGGSDFINSHKAYLGRPWKEYSRAVVMQSNIDGVIQSRGWIEWPGYGSSVYKTLYFAEYDNTGAGAETSGRVDWPGFCVIETPEASKFTVANLIDGNSWLPSTGVTFISGLR
ncbi:probable pectinesterase/pectinesterase inhibitor 54 [Primulina huaijiensis]|uniref:probable pectinesterase/pectinesterase inhibitor 54 n=1 Tax=Primulina huaijiensis TaxID=1492673 RepID=UPI003CC75615